MTDSTTAVKTCNRCGVTKPLDDFQKHSGCKSDGRRGRCRECAREYTRSYYAANTELCRERTRAWSAANSEAVKAKQKAYAKANADLLREKRRAYVAANPDKVREWKRTYAKAHAEEICKKSRQWRMNNPDKIKAHRLANAEKIREKRRAYYEQNVDKRRAWLEANAARTRAYANKRRALKVDTDCGCITGSSTQLVIAAYGNSCVYCRRPYEHLDHLVPLSRGGVHCLVNLRPACASCNLSKVDAPLDEFLIRRPELSGDRARQVLVSCPNQT